MSIDTEKKIISTGWSEEGKNQVFRFLEGLPIDELSQYVIRLEEEVSRVHQTFDEIYKRKQAENIPQSCAKY